MTVIRRYVVPIILGYIAGSILNMGIVMLGPYLIPYPEGTDASTMEGLIAAMPLFEVRHFMSPLMAHAAGTLLGAYVCTRLTLEKPWWPALVIGIVFMAGGIYMIKSIPSTPVWFMITDLAIAYIPMAFLGWKLGHKKGGK
jgi:hypothetical protein